MSPPGKNPVSTEGAAGAATCPSAPQLASAMIPARTRRRRAILVLEVLVEEALDPRPGVAQHVLAREVMELAGIRHELDERPLAFLQRLVDQLDRVQVWHVHVGSAMEHEHRPHELVDA